jgi:hypothetical protein
MKTLFCIRLVACACFLLQNFETLAYQECTGTSLYASSKIAISFLCAQLIYTDFMFSARFSANCFLADRERRTSCYEVPASKFREQFKDIVEEGRVLTKENLKF